MHVSFVCDGFATIKLHVSQNNPILCFNHPTLSIAICRDRTKLFLLFFYSNSFTTNPQCSKYFIFLHLLCFVSFALLFVCIPIAFILFAVSTHENEFVFYLFSYYFSCLFYLSHQTLIGHVLNARISNCIDGK